MKKSIQILALAVFALSSAMKLCKPIIETPKVTIEQGTLTGKVGGDGAFYEYVGIPYATINSSTRFKAPLPAPSWTGVFQATDDTQQCLQVAGTEVVGIADCLKVNVYVPAKAKKPLPVMFYIPGGGFESGNGGKDLYGPDFLMKKDIILVTINYRLGALGFLCLRTENVPGNAGLKDQVAALRWVKKNIAAFGGDPENITLFGESAGGASSSALFASETTNGLFERAIIQSGSTLASWAINRDPIMVASTLAKHFGHDTQDPDQLYEIFSSISDKDLMLAHPFVPFTGKYFDSQTLHLPCIETPIPGVEPILLDLPYNILKKSPKNMSVIFGSTSREGLLFAASTNSQEMYDLRNTHYSFASDLKFETEEKAAEIDAQAKHLYYGDEPAGFDNMLNTSDLTTHTYFEVPALLEAELILNSIDMPVYSFYFDYAGGRNFFKFMAGFPDLDGACHGDELFYLFNGTVWSNPIEDKDQVMIDWMTSMWTNFAKYGDPTPTSDTGLPIKWSPSTKETMNVLYIDDELHMGPAPSHKYYTFWRDVYAKYRNTKFGL